MEEDQEVQVKENILCTKNTSYEPDGGLGCEYFRTMKLFARNIAQYDAETGQTDTYASLMKRCIRTAIKIRSQGITENDLVCLCTYNHMDSCVPFIACAFLGIKVASLDPTISLEDTAYLLKQVKPALIFLVPESIKLVEESIRQADVDPILVIFGNNTNYLKFDNYLDQDEEEEDFKPRNTSPSDTQVVFFSSGTTGFPKGICQSSYALLVQAVNSINMKVVSSVNLYYSSLYWISSCLFLTSCILTGAARVICTTFDPEEVWRIIDRYKVTFLFLAPSQASDMLKASRPDGIDTSSLLCLLTGGGLFPEKQLIALRDLLPGTFVCQGYGQTEVAGILTLFNMASVKDNLLLHYNLNSCGRPVRGILYKVVEAETENLLGPNQQGELRIKSKFVMNSYYNLDSSETFDSEGWLKTGDIVYYDEDFCFYVVDRIKELLKYKSWHIAPAKLESILNEHPAVKKSLVIGIPDDDDGDHPMAIVILEGSAVGSVSEEEIEQYLAGRVQDRQRLRAGVKFVESLPLTPSGKIKRLEVKKLVLAGKI